MKPEDMAMTGKSDTFLNFFDLQNLPVAALILARDGLIQQANAAAAHLLAAPELIQQPFTPFVTPATQTRFTAFLHDVFAGQEQTVAEFPLSGEDNRWVRVEAQVVAQNDTAVCCLVLVEISHYKQAEERMRRNEQIFRLFVEHSPTALAMFDREMNYIVASRRYLLDYDLGEQELVGRSHYDIFPEISDRWRELHQRCLAGEVLRADEDAFPRADGRLDWVRWEIRPWYEENGEVGGIILFSEVITRQKAAEQELQQTQKRYQMLVEQNPAVIFLDEADEQGSSHYISPQVEKLLGYTPAEYAANPTLWHEQIYPEDYETANASIPEVLATGQAIAEYRMIRRDGRIVWVRDSSVLIRNEKGKPEFIQGFLEDITERKQAEESLKASEAFLQATLDALSAHIAILDESGEIVAVNEAWRTFGRQNDFTLENNGIGSSYLQVVDQAQGEWSDEAPAVAQAIRAIMAGEIDEAHIEYPCHSPTEKRWFMTHITGFAKSGQAHVVIAHENVTARKLAEESVRETKNLLEKVFASLHEAVFVIDPQNRTIITCNAAVEPIFGYKPEELIGRDTAVLYHSPEDFQRFGAIGGPELTRQGIFQTEFEMRHKDGHTIITENTVSALGEQNDWQDGVVSLVRDITTRKEAETKLRQSEERFRLLIENAPGAITLLRRDGSRKFVSESTKQVMGHRPEDILDGNLADLTHPEDIADLQAVVEKIKQEPGAVRTVQYRFKHKDGSWRWVESTISNLLHIPTIEALAFNFQDITERKQLEAQLQERVQLAEFQAAIGAALIQPGNLRQLLQRCAQAIVDSFEAAIARVWTFNEVDQMLELQASAGLYTHLDGKHNRIKIGELRIGRIAQEKEPHLSNDLTQDPLIGDPDWVRREGLRAFAGYPLLIDGRLVGTLAMFSRHILTGEHLQAMATIANNVALAIERKHAEDSLLQSQRQFRQLADAIPLIVWTAEPDGTIDYANQFFSDYTGAGDLDLTPEDWLVVLHPEDVERCLNAWAKSVQTGESFNIEYRIRRQDGTYHWHIVKATPIRNRDGQTIKWYGTATDIHERRIMEEEMRRLANRLTATLESITDGFHILDRDWRITYMNQEAERLVGYSRDELLGKVIWEKIPPTVGTTVYHEYHRARRENKAVVFEQFYPQLERWFEIRAYPSEEDLAVYFRDITARKEAEEQLNAQLEELRRWHKATLGREMRLLELKREVNTLLRHRGQPPRYPSAEATEP
jgi:PAS domain S-box-containing protein